MDMRRSAIDKQLEETFLSLSQEVYPMLMHHISATDYLALSQDQKRLVRSIQFVLPTANDF